MKMILTIPAIALLLLSAEAGAQRVLTLDECKTLAIESSNDLKAEKTKVEMADCDRKIAAANYLPKISATGTYQWTDHSIQLLSDDQKQQIRNVGGEAQANMEAQVSNAMYDGASKIITNKDLYEKIVSSQNFKDLVETAKGAFDIATPINSLSEQILSATELNTQNLVLGVVSVEQPLFVGGKIIASNKMAGYARDLAENQLQQKQEEVCVDVEQAYWQIVSIASKKKLAQSYSELLKEMMRNTEILVAEGLATQSDALAVKVKANEADMMLTKATNGLSLSKMLLCKKCGLPLDSEIVLADEDLDEIPVPRMTAAVSDEEVLSRRHEIKSLELAENIYKEKVAVVRADMMPTVALTANYLVTNPNLNNGFMNDFGGMFAAGVAVKVPIFHGTEALQKTKKAKAEATLTTIRMNDAKEMISLQLAQCRKQQGEAFENLEMTRSVLSDAEENLRKANVGYAEGIVSSNVVLQAQTAWLKAHSEHIEAGVNLQMCSVNLAKAEGRL